MEPEIVCEEIPQEDLPPEYCRYEDEGCELSGSCLHCPFSRCVYERPGGKRHTVVVMRNREIIRLFHAGKDTAELAAMFAITRRTIQRIVKNSRLKKVMKRRSDNQLPHLQVGFAKTRGRRWIPRLRVG